jgi:hypothetical protein
MRRAKLNRWIVWVSVAGVALGLLLARLLPGSLRSGRVTVRFKTNFASKGMKVRIHPPKAGMSLKEYSVSFNESDEGWHLATISATGDVTVPCSPPIFDGIDIHGPGFSEQIDRSFYAWYRELDIYISP